MITCNKCGKDNQDHYKFCLGCGAELPRASHAPKPFAANTPPQGIPQVRPAQPAPAAAPPPQAQPIAVPRPAAQPASVAAPVAAPASVAAPAGAGVTCPQCGHPNPGSNRFCASCGYNLAALQGGMPVHSQPAPVAPAPSVGVRVILTALRADGSEAGTYPLPEAPVFTVGRDTGSIFAGDSYLSPRHASFVRTGAQLSIRDENSLNGVYVKLQPNAPWPMQYHDVFRIGQEIIRFEPLVGQGPSPDGVERLGSPSRGYIGRIALVIGRDTTGNAFPVPETGIHLGRERGDVLFSEDGYVSGLHCRIAREQDGNIYLTDVGSSNGTFIRLSEEHTLAPGDVLLMGQQLFRVDM